MKPVPERRAALAAGNRVCAFCGERLSGAIYFCTAHWFEIPAKERLAVYAMHHRGISPASKVAKCVRILQEKQRNTNNDETKTHTASGPQLQGP